MSKTDHSGVGRPTKCLETMEWKTAPTRTRAHNRRAIIGNTARVTCGSAGQVPETDEAACLSPTKWFIGDGGTKARSGNDGAVTRNPNGVSIHPTRIPQADHSVRSPSNGLGHGVVSFITIPTITAPLLEIAEAVLLIFPGSGGKGTGTDPLVRR